VRCRLVLGCAEVGLEISVEFGMGVKWRCRLVGKGYGSMVWGFGLGFGFSVLSQFSRIMSLIFAHFLEWYSHLSYNNFLC